MNVFVALTSLSLVASTLACSGAATPDASSDETSLTDDTAADTSPTKKGAKDAGASAETKKAKREQTQELTELVTGLASRTAWPFPYDPDAILAKRSKEISDGDGSTASFLTALVGAFHDIPQGHQGLELHSGCGTLIPSMWSTHYGVCATAHPDGLLVSTATKGNPLRLHVGDTIFSEDGAPLDELLERASKRPVCGGTMPSRTSRIASTVRGYFGTVPNSAVLGVRALDGSTRSVTVHSEKAISTDYCEAPFPAPRANSTLKYVGAIPVFGIPTFVDVEEPFPDNPTQNQYEAYINAYTAKLAAEFDKVKAAPAIVIDLRGNMGGFTEVGLRILSGMPGANPSVKTYCQARIQDSSPPALANQQYAVYQLKPGGAFAYSGKVVLIVDAMNYSAADYFAYFAKNATNLTLVGAATAGAYGATSGSFDITGPNPATIRYDVNRCFATDGTPLETLGTVPHVEVSYAPTDLANGIDTVLNRAIEELAK